MTRPSLTLAPTPHADITRRGLAAMRQARGAPRNHTACAVRDRAMGRALADLTRSGYRNTVTWRPRRKLRFRLLDIIDIIAAAIVRRLPRKRP